MSDEPRFSASPTYAFGQLQRALQKATSDGDAAARRRAEDKVTQWQSVLAGMASGRVTVGSRTPVAETPAWVTLEVAHGGFATGRYLAESPLRDDEVARLRSLPEGVPGTTDRERLNLWYLSDHGQAELLAALSSDRYRVDVPEDAALMVVAWLLDRGHYASALDLVAELRPLMHRLRLTPRLEPVPQPTPGTVRLEPVAAVKESLRNATTPRQMAAMNETLRVWHPLYDRLVALWCDTVDGDLPRLTEGTSRGVHTVVGGWPCQRWPEDWAELRRQWLVDYHRARITHTAAKSHLHPKGNFSRLRRALEAAEQDSRKLSAREVGWIRRALANTITKHGEPGSEKRAALRITQAEIAGRPTYAALAQVLVGRLDRYPDDGGIPSLDPIAQDVTEHDVNGVPSGTPIPAHLVEKATRALEAPIEELVERGVISSGEVLARVLPQLTGQLFAVNIKDSDLAKLYAKTYGAFRRRRSLLLLNLEHQVRFEELPWIDALQGLRSRRVDTTHKARQALLQTTVTTLSAFPQAIVPNPLLREIGALAEQAELPLPLVEEVAADIFMGMFTVKWRRAAAIASKILSGSLYARYYDLPAASVWNDPASEPRTGLIAKVTRRWGKQVADDFAALCRARAREAQLSRSASYVAINGTVLEQSQILTTHNLAVLVDGLDLHGRIVELAPDLADRAFAWAVRRQAQPTPSRMAALQMIKNAAYAWRQGIFFLSFCDEQTQQAITTQIGSLAIETPMKTEFGPAVEGLAHIVAGGRFDTDGFTDAGQGRRFLGWSTGPHWCLREEQFSGDKALRE